MQELLNIKSVEDLEYGVNLILRAPRQKDIYALKVNFLNFNILYLKFVAQVQWKVIVNNKNKNKKFLN